MSLITRGLGISDGSSTVSAYVYIQEPSTLSNTYGHLTLSSNSPYTSIVGTDVKPPALSAFSPPISLTASVVDLRPSVDGLLN